MQYFIGITPPDALKQKIISFQKSFLGNQVPNIAEPHITVKAKGGLTDDESWIPLIETAAKSLSKFELRFDGIDSFGDTVLFLAPIASPELIELHQALIKAVRPERDLIDKYFEGDKYQPHLTLGGTPWGMNSEDMTAMKERAHTELADVESFIVDHIRIYGQDDPNGPYRKLKDAALKD